jgi:hypothetical protein
MANSVAWTKIQGGQTTNVNIANSNGKYQGGSVNNPSLTILNIAQSDEANYICSATNIAGTSSSQQALSFDQYLIFYGIVDKCGLTFITSTYH